MAEVFGIGAGIVGIVGLTLQISQVAIRFGLDWKHAPKDVKSFMAELQSLETVLMAMRTNLLQNAEFISAFETHSSVLLSQLGPSAPTATETKITIESCRTELEKVLNELKGTEIGYRAGWSRFKHAFLAKGVRESVEKLHRHCELFNKILAVDTAVLGASTLNEVKESRREQIEHHDSAEKRTILDWLSSLSFEDKQKDIFAKAHPGTGHWLLNLPDFRKWQNGDQDNSVLWCPGIPGAGKSVMTSIVVDHLKRKYSQANVAIAFVYCDHKDRQNQTDINVLSSLVKQLVLQKDGLPKAATDLYIKCQHGSRAPSSADYLELLSSLLVSNRKSFILVDALDEHMDKNCDEDAGQLKFLQHLQHVQRQSPYSLLVTSRYNRLIEEQLGTPIRIEIRANDSDIRSYVTSRIYDDSKFRFAAKMRDDPDLANTILTQLTEKAQGMFLLPRLHLDRLGCQSSIRDLRSALNKLPSKLESTYDDAMERIKGQIPENAELGMSTLTWISTAMRPLRLDELQHALALRPGDSFLDREAIVEESLIVSVSAGLVTVDATSSIIRLVHFTVEEYFQNRRDRWFPSAQKILAEICLTHLSFDRFSWYQYGKWTPEELGIEAAAYPLSDYAASQWGHHVRGEPEIAIQDLALDFLTNDSKTRFSVAFMRRSLIFDRSMLRHHLIGEGSIFGIHLTAKFGLVSLATELLRRGVAVDSLDSRLRTPLSWATEHGRTDLVRLLLRKGARLDSKDMWGETPLSFAAARGHDEVVQVLLAHGAMIDTMDKWAITPLLRAVSSDRENTVRILLDKGANINTATVSGFTPLMVAAGYGSMGVFKMLLDRGANIGGTDKAKWTSLTHAAGGGLGKVVGLHRGLRSSPLMTLGGHHSQLQPCEGTGMQYGQVEVVKILMDHGAKALDMDTDGRTTAHFAADYDKGEQL